MYIIMSSVNTKYSLHIPIISPALRQFKRIARGQTLSRVAQLAEHSTGFQGPRNS